MAKNRPIANKRTQSKGLRFHTCGLCGKVYKSVLSLRKHAKTHPPTDDSDSLLPHAVANNLLSSQIRDPIGTVFDFSNTNKNNTNVNAEDIGETEDDDKCQFDDNQFDDNTSYDDDDDDDDDECLFDDNPYDEYVDEDHEDDVNGNNNTESNDDNSDDDDQNYDDDDVDDDNDDVGSTDCMPITPPHNNVPDELFVSTTGKHEAWLCISDAN